MSGMKKTALFALAPVLLVLVFLALLKIVPYNQPSPPPLRLTMEAAGMPFAYNVNPVSYQALTKQAARSGKKPIRPIADALQPAYAVYTGKAAVYLPVIDGQKTILTGQIRGLGSKDMYVGMALEGYGVQTISLSNRWRSFRLVFSRQNDDQESKEVAKRKASAGALLTMKLAPVAKLPKSQNTPLYHISQLRVSGDGQCLDTSSQRCGRWLLKHTLVPNNSGFACTVSDKRYERFLFTAFPFHIQKNKALALETPVTAAISISYLHNGRTLKKDTVVLHRGGFRCHTCSFADVSQRPLTVRITYADTRDHNALSVGTCTAFAPRDLRGSPPVLLTVIDALRADHLGCYGCSEDTSPVIDGLAQEGKRYSHAYAACSWTMPSAFALFYGKQPHTENLMWGDRLIPKAHLPNAMEYFQTQGYLTVGIMGNPLLCAENRFNKGFDIFFDARYFMPAHAVNRAVLHVLPLMSELPVCMTVWYIDPHDPYCPPADATGPGYEKEPCPQGHVTPLVHQVALQGPDAVEGKTKRRMLSLYDQEIAFVDGRVGELFSAMRTLGVYEKSIIVLTADHGEAFLEHGFLKHGYDLYEETIRIPLIMRFPGKNLNTHACAQNVSQFDIFPTLWHGLGWQCPGFYQQGMSLFEPVPADRIISAYTFANSPVRFMLRQGKYKYIRFDKERVSHTPAAKSRVDNDIMVYILKQHPARALFDLSIDAGETRNLFRHADYDQTTAYFMGIEKTLSLELDTVYQRDAFTRPEVLEKQDSRLKEQLKALGYIH